MCYLLRLVQRINQAHQENFLALEKEFVRFEKEQGMPQGRRYLPVTGLLPTNTLIWEYEFDTLEELTKHLNAIYAHPEHERLLDRQVSFMQDSYTEIYKRF